MSPCHLANWGVCRPFWRMRGMTRAHAQKVVRCGEGGVRHVVALDQSTCSGWGDRDSANPGPRRERTELRGGAPPPPSKREIKIARSAALAFVLFWDRRGLCTVRPLVFCSGSGAFCALFFGAFVHGSLAVLVAHEFGNASADGGSSPASLRPAGFASLDPPDRARGPVWPRGPGPRRPHEAERS